MLFVIENSFIVSHDLAVDCAGLGHDGPEFVKTAGLCILCFEVVGLALGEAVGFIWSGYHLDVLRSRVVAGGAPGGKTLIERLNKASEYREK